MIAPRLQRQLSDPFRKRINREPSPLLARAVPWLSIMLASLTPTWPIIASAPVLPPVGFLFLLAWRQLRPGLLPVWAGLPLGLFDDLYSGQPFGSAMLLWSLAMLVLEVIEARFPWRNFLIDWLEASGLIVAFLLLSLIFANAAGAASPIRVILPQMAFAVVLYPLAGRLVWLFDRFRLLPFRVIS